MTQQFPRRLRQRVDRGKRSYVAIARDYVPEESPEFDADGVSHTMRAAAGWAWRFVVVVAAIAILVYLFRTFSTLIIPILVAIVLSVGLFPIFRFFAETLRFPRMLASLTTVLLLIAFVVGLMTAAGREIYSQFFKLWESALAGINELLVWAADGPLHLDTDAVMAYIQNLWDSVADYSGLLASGALSITSSITAIAAGSILAIFLVIFFLKDGRIIWLWCVRLMPVPWRERAHEAAIRGFATMQGYVKSTIFVAGIDAIGIGLGAFFLGVPLALPLGVLVFMGSFIPFVGAIMTGAVAVLVALVDGGFSTALLMLLIVLLVQQIEGNVLQPLIMGHNVSLHPAAVVLTVAGGAFAAGIAGAIFAVPLVAFLNTVTLYLKGYDKYPHLADKVDRPGGPPGTLEQMVRATYGFTDDVEVDVDESILEAPDGSDSAKETEGEPTS